ncbi:MAG: DUF4373 domain-containing protein [Clostridia bacterium]|nr:DUF4373 domain-containing protein [Clostridia bacterium]
MARPVKDGLDYFPMDCIPDRALDLLQAKHGLESFGMVIKLWMSIFREGWYVEWDIDTILFFCSSNSISVERFDRILTDALERGIFCRWLYEKYSVLTSQDIQRRYFSASIRRKRIRVCEEYLLIDPAEFGFVRDDADTELYIKMGKTPDSGDVYDGTN